MSFDEIIEIGDSLIQHGKYNDRIYLMKLSSKDYPGIIDKMDRMAQEHGYSKIFAKIPDSMKVGFLENGFAQEASIPHFYNGKENAAFLAKYYSEERRRNPDSKIIEKVIRTAKSKKEKIVEVGLPKEFQFRICQKTDAEDMAGVYRKVFETYPFPIHEPKYLAKTMAENIIYFGIWKNQRLIALSSAEMDEKSLNVEMTDFATLPEARSHGLAVFLLDKMEAEMKKRSFFTAYTIARSLSFGMNIAFAKLGYTFSGTLINNTNISGKMESMNVWYKALT